MLANMLSRVYVNLGGCAPIDFSHCWKGTGGDDPGPAGRPA